MGEERIKKLEAALASASADNRMLHSVIDQAPDFLAHITADGKFLFLNRFTPGLGPDDLKHVDIYTFTQPEYHATMRETIARVVETRSPQSYETVGQGSKGPRTPYFTRVSPMIGEDGSVTSVILISTDVSRLKETEAALAESQAVLHQVLAATEMGTWWWDLEKRTGGRDQRTAAILGFDTTVENPSEDQLDAQQHPDDQQRVRDEFTQALATGVYGPIEHRVIRRDGTLRWVHASGRVLELPSGKRLVGGVVDITNRKRVEEQLAQAQKLESIGRLAGGIAHDFNNMLTAILSYTDFALGAVPTDSVVARDLEQIRVAGDRSIALTAQLLAFARQQLIEPSLTMLDELVLRVDKLLRRLLGANIEVVTLLHARTPVRIDVSQFEQVLVNLATNARDAMRDGGWLTIETEDVDLDADAAGRLGIPAGAYVTLSVTDTGEGIPPHLLPRVFEPFFTTKEHGKGTGLGLATCYGVVVQNRGHILVDSTLGTGTSFTIYLPRADGVVTRVEPPETSTTARGTETVLVVEDEPSVRAVAIKSLEQAGYHVLAAANGSEALTLTAEHAAPIDLLVTDVVMPQLGGPQLAQLLLERRPELAVLFVSGYTDSPAIHQGVFAREVDLLQKPFSPATLALRVRQALDRKSHR